MNWHQVEGHWNQVRGKIRTQFGRLTNDDLDRMSGRRDEMVRILCERYGIERDAAGRQLDEWLANFDSKGNKKKPRRQHH